MLLEYVNEEAELSILSSILSNTLITTLAIIRRRECHRDRLRGALNRNKGDCEARHANMPHLPQHLHSFE